MTGSGVVSDWLDRPPFALGQADKERWLLPALIALTDHHAAACAPYRRLLETAWPNWERAETLAEIPFLPVDLFRSHGERLITVPPEAIRSWVRSSGTSGRTVSRVGLDDRATQRQARALAAVLRPVLGPVRLPMLILDARATLAGDGATSARAAGILGMMKLGRDYTFALQPTMELDDPALTGFLARHGQGPFLVYGTTAVVWLHFHRALEARSLAPDFSRGILIHGGGWKRLTEQAVDTAAFRAGLGRSCGLTRIHDFYGMAEQIGTVFLEGPDGLLHPPGFAEVIIRDPQSWRPVPMGETGVIQVLSLLPESYPGHALVTGDLGVIEAVDAPGWKGLRVLGRAAGAPLRGCGGGRPPFEGALDVSTSKAVGTTTHPDLTRLVPKPGPVTVPTVLAALTPPPDLAPFAPETLAFLGALHRRLVTDAAARQRPDLQALAFWLRPAALARLAQTFRAGLPAGTLAVPRGLVFHVPPANVDTLFVYSWVPALLAGNRNLIRLSERGAGPAALVLLEVLGDLLAAPEAEAVAAASVFVRYPRNDAVTTALSQAADARLLWGGDAAVTALRALGPGPHTLDLAFPDRVSWAALAAEPYLALDSERRQAVAEALSNDLFWFDQQACASPRLLLWCGGAAAAAQAAADLYPRVGARAQALVPEPGPAARLERLAAWHRAVLDLPVAELLQHGDRFTVVRLASLDAADRAALTVGGLGVVLEAHIPDLSRCLPLVTRRVQTLAHFGFTSETLTHFARTLNGRGLDRLVPLGQALTFATVWDGTDLLRALTRLVTVG